MLMVVVVRGGGVRGVEGGGGGGGGEGGGRGRGHESKKQNT